MEKFSIFWYSTSNLIIDMLIANLRKRKDAKLRTLDVRGVMVAGCQKSRNWKKLPILFAICSVKKLTIFFAL